MHNVFKVEEFTKLENDIVGEILEDGHLRGPWHSAGV